MGVSHVGDGRKAWVTGQGQLLSEKHLVQTSAWPARRWGNHGCMLSGIVLCGCTHRWRCYPKDWLPQDKPLIPCQPGERKVLLLNASCLREARDTTPQGGVALLLGQMHSKEQGRGVRTTGEQFLQTQVSLNHQKYLGRV